MRVKKETNVQDETSLVFSWDKAARTYFDHFEIQLENQKVGLQKNFRNVLTSWKDASRFHANFKEIDLLKYRQILGDISKQEVKELNKVMGGRYYFTKSRSQPAHVFAWDKGVTLFWALGAAFATYGTFVKRYSIIWLAMPFAPCWVFIAHNWARQPYQDIENAYRYTIQKRAATVEYDKNRAKVEGAIGAFPAEKEQLKKYLVNNNQTLYDLEADVYERMNKGTL